MLPPKSKRLLIWFDRNHTCASHSLPSPSPSSPTKPPPKCVLNLFTNKRFSAVDMIHTQILCTALLYVYRNQYHVARLSPDANKNFIYLLHCMYRDQSAYLLYAISLPCSYFFFFFFNLALNFSQRLPIRLDVTVWFDSYSYSLIYFKFKGICLNLICL